jgi:hypothetical protein
VHRPLVLDFLRGLSRDELECIAEFQGACIIESEHNPYRLMPEFFDSGVSDRWISAEDRAQKTLVVLAYLDHMEGCPSLHHSAVNSV